MYVGELAQQAIALAQSNPEGRAAQVEQLLDRSTDVPTVGRLVLGRHWALATQAQRDEYLKLFRGYVLAGVSRRLGAAQGIVKVDVTGSQPATNDDRMVATRITLGMARHRARLSGGCDAPATASGLSTSSPRALSSS